MWLKTLLIKIKKMSAIESINKLVASVFGEKAKYLVWTSEENQLSLKNFVASLVKEEVSKRVSRGAKIKRDPCRPKRPQTTFFRFSSDERKSSEEFLSAKELGIRWNKFKNSNNKKDKMTMAKYEKELKTDKGIYEEAMKNYLPSEEYRCDNKQKVKRVGPKHAISSYIFFSKLIRSSIKEELGDKATNAEITTEIGKRWKNVDKYPLAVLRAEACKFALDDKKRYENEKGQNLPEKPKAASKAKAKAKPVEENVEEDLENDE